MGGGNIYERFAIQFVDGCYNQTGSGENIGGFSSLALNPTTNAVNLSYYDFNNKDLKYAYKEDSSNIWYTMSIDGSGINNDVGKFTSLAVDNSGNRHISYFDESTSLFVPIARTSYPVPNGLEYHLGIKFGDTTVRMVGLPKIHELEDLAPTMTFRYIESPDGVYHYPLFDTEEEANYYDLQEGGTGTSHTHTYADDPTNTT